MFEGSEDGRDEGSGRGLKTRWVQRVGEDQEDRAEGTGAGGMLRGRAGVLRAEEVGSFGT